MASHATTQKKLPKHIFSDLIRFIHEKYKKQLPNTLLIAQAFILEYPDYGREYGLPAINKAIEEGINQGLFKLSRFQANSQSTIDFVNSV